MTHETRQVRQRIVMRMLCVKKISLVLFAVGLVATFSGCSKTRDLQGKWVFDRPYTEEHIPKEPEKPSASPAGMADAFKPALAAMLVPMLISQLDGAALTINSKEMIFTTKDGNGKANDYEVLAQPDAHTWQVKGTDGKIETYTREGDRLALAATGDLHMKMYFRRADK